MNVRILKKIATSTESDQSNDQTRRTCSKVLIRSRNIREMGAQLAGWETIPQEEGWRKGPWTAEEDRLLMEYVNLHGEGRWNSVARLAGKLRWVNYLRPDLKRGRITPHEESIILELHARWGNR
ncbi:hypothetical protein Sjap_006157 [Stephania japonica]|uniref:Uncharacterized protein n=1 Tax=Stephania japonica TaxID=461633 RepID=A0AAP0K711_9MAGN